MASVAPSERLRRELEDVIGGTGEDLDPIEAIGRRPAGVDISEAQLDLARERVLSAALSARTSPS